MHLISQESLIVIEEPNEYQSSRHVILGTNSIRLVPFRAYFSRQLTQIREQLLLLSRPVSVTWRLLSKTTLLEQRIIITVLINHQPLICNASC